VSAPCTWEEVEHGKVNPDTFTIRTLPARIKKTGDIWADLPRRRRSLKSATEKLKRLL
jgi:bifunctional non-homologous end joining protein LigD